MTDDHTPTANPATTNSDILRQAAQKARTLAENATPGPWGNPEHEHHEWIIYNGKQGHLEHMVACTVDGTSLRADADAHHITAWHPGVALAVAAIWDAAADSLAPHPLIIHAARTFLNQP